MGAWVEYEKEKRRGFFLSTFRQRSGPRTSFFGTQLSGGTRSPQQVPISAG